MSRTILITGATDGIGLHTAKILSDAGHRLILHGRSAGKLERLRRSLTTADNQPDCLLADLASPEAVTRMLQQVLRKHDRLDVLINNAGVFKISAPKTPAGLDIRFMVNTLSPYALTLGVLPLLTAQSRVVNVASAAQSPVELQALNGNTDLTDMEAYAQSKLALIMWTQGMAASMPANGPVMLAVNPGSLLASKMVRDGFGVAGKDIGIGADILTRAALADEFASASGRYFNNDVGRFSSPHADAGDDRKCRQVIMALDALATRYFPHHAA